MDRNPERITFDPLYYPTKPAQGFSLTPLTNVYDGQRKELYTLGNRDSGWASAGVSSTFLYIHICTWPIWPG